MALSMDEQRMLAEIERRLSAEDPKLAARLSSFKRPGPSSKLRSPRNRVIGTLFTVVLLAVVSMMVYAMVPFRAHSPKSGSSPQASNSGVSVPARAQVVPRPGSSVPNASAHTGALNAPSARTVTRYSTQPRSSTARTSHQATGKAAATGGTKTTDTSR